MGLTTAPAGYRFAHCSCCQEEDRECLRSGKLHEVSCPECLDRTLVAVPGAPPGLVLITSESKAKGDA